MSDGAFSPALRFTTVGVFALGFLIAFEALAVTTAMPLAARDLDGTALYALAFSAFSAAGVIGNVVAGAWSDRGGPARPLLVGALVFTLGLVVSGTAWTMPGLIVGRAVQGFGAGGVGVALYVLVARVYPDRVHPRVFALLAAAWVLPALVGPFAAGAVSTLISWHWVFLGILPLVAMATSLLVPTLRRLAAPGGGPAGTAASTRRIGWAVLAAAALLVLRPALDVPAIGPVLASAAAVVAILAVRPLLPPGTLIAARGIAAVITARAVFSAGFGVADAYLPYSLIALRDVSPVIAGGIATVGAVSWAAGSEAQSRLSRLLSDPRCIGLGACAFFAGAATIGLGTGLALIPVVVAGWLAAGLGIGIAYPRLATSALALSAPEERGRNSASLQIGEGFGNGLALTLVGVVTAFAATAEFPAAFGLAAALALVALVVAPRVQRLDASAG